MDIGLPGLNGIEATIEIMRHCPDCKVIILSMYDDESRWWGPSARAPARSFSRAPPRTTF